MNYQILALDLDGTPVSYTHLLNLFGSEMKSITDCRACQRIRDHVGAWQWNDAFKGGFIRQMRCV